jgi:hypothetical protein
MAEPKLTTILRERVAQRSDRCCEYCWSQSRFSPDPFSVEHIVPRSKGGSDELDNLAFACQGCNNHKYNHLEGRDPVNGRLVALYHPYQQKWADHFAWNEDFTLMIGLTPTGRATVERLRLNREGVVNLRRVLRTIDEHPPKKVGI